MQARVGMSVLTQCVGRCSAVVLLVLFDDSIRHRKNRKLCIRLDIYDVGAEVSSHRTFIIGFNT